MSRARTFTKSEIRDAARAAAETGLCATLTPSGEIVFTQGLTKDTIHTPTPEDLLQRWLNGNQTRGRA